MFVYMIQPVVKPVVSCKRGFTDQRTSLANKLDDFETVVRLDNSDVVCVTETRLSADVPSESVSMNGFSFGKDRNRQGGDTSETVYHYHVLY